MCSPLYVNRSAKESPGQKRKRRSFHVISALPHKAVIDRRDRDVCFVPIVLQESFEGDERNFPGPLMRFARRDVRDHIASQKNDHGASYPRYKALQRWSRPNINVCEISGVVRFSTFATLSARNGPAGWEAILEPAECAVECGNGLNKVYNSNNRDRLKGNLP